MNEIPSANWWRPDVLAGTMPAWTPDVPSHSAVAAVGGRLGFRALVAFTIVLVAAPQEFVGSLKPLRLAFVAAILAIACYVLDRLSGRLRAPVAREVWIALILVTWAVIMVPFSYWPGGSVSMLLDLYLKSVAVFILLAGIVNTRERLRTIAWTLTWCIVPVAATALLHYRAGVFMPSAPGRIQGYGTSGLAGNPNDLALLLNLVIPLVAALAMTSTHVRSRVVALGILGLSIAAVIVTFSRSGFITLAVIAAMYLWRMARRGHLARVAAILGTAVLVAAMAPTGYGARLATVSNIDTDPTGSAQNRWRDTVVATEFAIAHPIIGAGPGMDFLALNELRGAAWLSVHDAYLNYAVDLGLPGLILFLVLFASCLKAALAAERLHTAGGRDDDVGRIAAAIRISLVAFSVAAFFYPVAYHAFFYYFAGLAVAARSVPVTVPGRETLREACA